MMTEQLDFLRNYFVGVWAGFVSGVRASDEFVHETIWQSRFANYIFPDNWPAEARLNVTWAALITVAIWTALTLTFVRRLRKGFRGFDFTSAATVNWMASLGVYFVLVGIRIYQLIGTTIRQPTPWWITAIRDYALLATILFIIAIIRDKRVLVPVDAPASGVVPRRRKDDWSKEP